MIQDCFAVQRYQYVLRDLIEIYHYINSFQSFLRIFFCYLAVPQPTVLIF